MTMEIWPDIDSRRKLAEETLRRWRIRREAPHPFAVWREELMCPLCGVFARTADYGGCTGCPVQLETGRSGCMGTPYYGVREAWDKWVLLSEAEGRTEREAARKKEPGTKAAFVKACDVEIKFLETVLEKWLA